MFDPMNYVQILSTSLSALSTITKESYADLMTSTVNELAALRRMQAAEGNPDTFRSRENVITRLCQTMAVLKAHSHYHSYLTTLMQKATA